MPIADFVYIGIVPWPTLADSCRNQSQIKRKKIFFLRLLRFSDKKSTKPGQSQSENLFLEIIMFLGQKIDKSGKNSKL